MEKLPNSSPMPSSTISNSLNSTVRTQIRTLQNTGEINMYDDAAVQNAAQNNGMSELVYYIENLRKNPRTEYVGFLLFEHNDEEEKSVV